MKTESGTMKMKNSKRARISVLKFQTCCSPHVRQDLKVVDLKLNFMKQQRDDFDVENRAHVDDSELNNFKIIKDQFALILVRLHWKVSDVGIERKWIFGCIRWSSSTWLETLDITEFEIKFEFETILLETREASKLKIFSVRSASVSWV